MYRRYTFRVRARKAADTERSEQAAAVPHEVTAGVADTGTAEVEPVAAATAVRSAGQAVTAERFCNTAIRLRTFF